MKIFIRKTEKINTEQLHKPHYAPVAALRKEVAEGQGRSQKAIKLEELPGEVYKYADERKEGVVSELAKNSKGLDLTSPESINELGERLKIDNLGTSYRVLKKADEPLDEFLVRAKNDQYIERQVRSNRPYMTEADQVAADSVANARNRLKNLNEVTPFDIEILDAALTKERELFKKYNPERPNGATSEIDRFVSKKEIEEAKSVLSEYDYVKNIGKDGKKYTYVYNDYVLPRSLTMKNLGAGVTPLDFEAAQMAKQYRMTNSAMVKHGNERLNEVSQFILDRYPQEGFVLKRAMTSADHIFEEINNVKNKAINDMNDAVEQALNTGGIKQQITNEDIANYIKNEILPKFTDKTTGNPVAGLDKEYKAISDFADGYRRNGFAKNKYGDIVYSPLNIKELREIRIKLDDVAKFNSSKLEPSAISEAARDLRTWVEDEVVSRAKKIDIEVGNKYEAAKKNYGLSKDAGKIVDLAAKKAAKDSNFSLFYSGVGSAVGASVAGVPGAIVGGLVGGAARNALREFSGALSVFMSRNLAKNVEQYEKLIDSTAKAFFRPLEAGTKAYIIVPKDNDKDIAKIDYKRLMAEISDREKYVEDFVDKNEDLFAQYPETSQKILDTTLRARDFLLTKIPQNPYVGNPWKEKTWEPSPLEINKYMRYREAVNNPSTILRQIRDGYVTPEAIEVLNMVYPETKNELMKSFLNEADRAKSLPVSKRVELFKIFGIQLDTFMSGKNFIEAQAESNGQAHKSAQENGKQDFKPQNTFKTNIGKKDSTLGNSTLR